MRRNTITLIKYLIGCGIFLAAGPTIIRYLFGNSRPRTDFQKERRVNVEDGPNPGNIPVNNMVQEAGLDTKELKEIDWHDYKAIAEEQQRTGLGEQGSAVILTAEEEKKKGDLYKVNGFNAYASDKISLQRALKDIRHEQCKSKKYLNKLPTASIIVPFHNEHWSTLLRTAQSVIDRSPPHLLKEVILVDDFSSKEHCKQQLDDYVAEHYTKVRVVRAEKREGLIRTRLLGARAAKGDVLIFLDSHCEVNINWLPPLLDPIARDQKTVVCPFIDVIDYETFAYRAQDEGARGAFDWEFFYKRLPLLPEDKKHPADHFKSPVMAGGLFAIHQEWFWMLGGYDPGLDIWGGEQYELSFKIWQCGGMMVDSPCSRIGHVYRKFAPFPNPGVGDFIGRNYKRVAEVWMDEYAEYLYKRRPHYKTIDAGDLTEQKAIREKLHCKSFKWFMTEVAFDLVKVYPPIEPTPLASGEVRNQANDKCIDTRYKGQNERFQLESCIKDGQGAGGEQQLEFSWHKDIRPKARAVCFDAAHSAPKSPVILYNCHGMGGNQRFKYNLETNQLFHPVSGQCLDCDKENLEIFMNPCDAESMTQKWKWEKMNIKEVKKDWPLPLD